ncbi:hypothetical protein G9C98_008180 [Cotesia typhae]|uniref:Uncharacterized protein n=1 Tax=Cotesia typhae TaxID=2053667 RepID=A0A8J5QZK8_9HYME|nr:hypothetical protein G9C98_008180 [Cotesia typhae]
MPMVWSRIIKTVKVNLKKIILEQLKKVNINEYQKHQP